MDGSGEAAFLCCILPGFVDDGVLFVNIFVGRKTVSAVFYVSCFYV